MQHYIPDYVRSFHCIAAACPDSCCQGWDVVIDEAAEAAYRRVEGALGERLRRAIITDSDGDRIFQLAAEKKCPFWGKDRLCELYKALGEESLCRTCALFPRITMDYTVFTEHTLALACPEAARLILTARPYTAFADTVQEDCTDYDAALMRRLLTIRRRAAELLTDSQPLGTRLTALDQFIREAQEALTGFAEDDDDSIIELYKQMDYIDEDNRAAILRAAAAPCSDFPQEQALTKLALYWLYRYLLTAIDGLDLLSPLRFLTASVTLVSRLAEEIGDLTKAAQLYSKEIEQSYENMEVFGL